MKALIALLLALSLQLDPAISVEFATRQSQLPRTAVINWLQQARSAVVRYYGKFPVEHLNVVVYDEHGDEIGFATTGWQRKEPLIEIPIGIHIDITKFNTAWTATHEMVHLAFPLVDEEDKWVAEGMATYIEPLARLQIKQFTREALWWDFVENAPEGLPASGRGLRGSHSWGEVYWGGALYCLLCDIEIRKQTQNRRGFQDAMRAIMNDGATVNSDYSALEALKIGDKSLGVRVLQDYYTKMSLGSIRPNLNQLWRDLGVKRVGNTIKFDESAPLAPIRRAIERG